MITPPSSKSAGNDIVVSYSSLLIALIGPIMIYTAYLLVSRLSAHAVANYGDFVALGCAILMGVVFLWRALRGGALRLIACAAYSAAVAAFLFFYSLAFVCAVFHDCL